MRTTVGQPGTREGRSQPERPLLSAEGQGANESEPGGAVGGTAWAQAFPAPGVSAPPRAEDS